MSLPWPSLRWEYSLLVAGLSSCSVLPESSPQDIYRLPPSSVTASEGEGSEVVLRINTPSADELLSSTRIIVIPEGNQVNIYRDVRWSPAGEVPEVVIRLDARLAESTGKRIIASRRFEICEAANSARLPAVVAAFGRAGDALARALIDWTLLNIK